MTFTLRTLFSLSSFVLLGLSVGVPASALGQEESGESDTLEARLLTENVEELASAAERFGDAKRGAVLFYQPLMNCRRCHGAANAPAQVGPDLMKLEQRPTMAHIVQSILMPSKEIKKSFESVTVLTDDGKTQTGLLDSEDAETLRLKDPSRPGDLIEIAKDVIDERVVSKVSVMPKGLANQLSSRQQFLDLAKYVSTVTAGGISAARDLEPPAALYRLQPLPEYEKNVDHAGLIADLNQEAFKRGEKIYNRLCINCHGTVDRPGSLPTSLRFASGKFKNGNDPYQMYQTLSHGFGMMVAQRWMVPIQKYDVIHYIREAYLKPHNDGQYARIDSDYLGKLPEGDTRGPEPVDIEPWITMDYGSQLTASYEIGKDASNFAYKGVAVRLDSGPGGVARGRHWMVFDHDTFRMAAAWSGRGFIDWNGIMFNGRHAIHPRVVGDVNCQNLTGPGWANPETGSFDDPRFRGRDDRPYGPLPREWARYRGMYYHEDRTIVSYEIGDTSILEMPTLISDSDSPVYGREFEIGPRSRDLTLQVASLRTQAGTQIQALELPNGRIGAGVLMTTGHAAPQPVPQTSGLKFDGGAWLLVNDGDRLNMASKDYTLQARIRTTEDGSIFTQSRRESEWVPDGKSLFIRGGQLVFDIGWVGAVRGQTRVADGKWHDVALTWRSKDGRVQLFVDGKLDGAGELSPKANHKRQVVRLGYTSANFPRPSSAFKGDLESIRFYQELLEEPTKLSDASALAEWKMSDVQNGAVTSTGRQQLAATIQRGAAQKTAPSTALMAGLQPAVEGADWIAGENGELRLSIPAGKVPLRFVLWFGAAESNKAAETQLADLRVRRDPRSLKELTNGGPARWRETLTTQVKRGDDSNAFAVDILSWPEENPWLCRVRLTGFDFYEDGNAAAVCAWDGDVWLVEGLLHPGGTLKWQRIASGLFQPLGLRIVDGQIFVTCRDQLVILRDLNGDRETDFYECFNNDHQVTEHFHEFAMGLQTDDDGNFYYAKSARHALPALVAHHGTLLRVSPDGSRTDIVATGFRAANGVCLNEDGSFIVTDQEGHWNPKNRINWVREGGFYGNMYGYHDVTDSSDSAMEQPLCWITNSFDRSPSELLWVNSPKWGALNGRLLNFSYGYGKVYVVPHENVNGQMQGGMCELPIPQFPTGVMRGRFHSADEQLYACGMFAWAGTQHHPGGFYRIRATGKPMHLPTELNAEQGGVRVAFTEPVDAATASDPKSYAIRTWSLKRTKNYGSKHYDEEPLEIQGAEVSADGKSVFLKIADVQPTWCMEIQYRLKDANGAGFSGRIHNTIHQLSESKR